MICSLSPQPTDAELLAYLDGDSRLADHIDDCPVCSARIQILAAEERLMQQKLYRAGCPSAHELGEYALGLVTQAQHKAIAAHLEICPACNEELETLQTFLLTAAPAPAPAVSKTGQGERIRILIARLIEDGRTALQGIGGMQPALAGVRGSETGPMIYGAEDYQLAIEFLEDPDKPGKRVLFGLLIGDDDPSAFEVELWREKSLVAHAAVDPYGNFSISDLQPGAYDMRLVRPRLAIRLDALSV